MLGLKIHFVQRGEIDAGDFNGTPAEGYDLRISDFYVIDEGMAGTGLPAVAIRIKLADGREVVAQTSARLINMAVKAMVAKYPKIEE